MNPLIERYVYDVVRRLPEKDRAEVRAELVSNIEAMLPENPSDEEVIRVLESLGAPSKMAGQYRTSARYLISPAVFEDYWMVLKIVGSVLFVVTLISQMIGEMVLQSQSPSVSGLISGIFKVVFASLFESAVSAFAWVTGGFWVFEQFGQRKQRKWTVQRLVQIPKQQSSISRSSTVVSAAFAVVLNAVWIVVIYRYADYIAWYQTGQPTVPLFYVNILQSMVPIILILAVLSLALHIVKIVFGAWSYPLALLNAAYHVANAVFVAYFLNFSHVFSQAFIAKLAAAISQPVQAVTQGFAIGCLVITALAAVGALVECATGFYRAYRNAA